VNKPVRVRIVGSAALALLLLGSACSPDGGTSTGSGTPQTAPAGAVEVVVSSSPEKVTLLTDLAKRFNSETHTVGGKPVYVTVQKTSSGTGADALVDDWPDSVGQARPTVFAPSASIWGAVVNERRTQAGKAQIVPRQARPVMLTPVVIAMPEPMAKALGWPDTPIGWADILALAQDPQGWAKYGHPEWGRFKLGKTDPHISTTGFNTVIAEAYAAAGKQRDLTLAEATSPQTQQFLAGVESSVVHYGDTTLTFLENLQRADERGAATSYISAVAVEEVSVIDYNQGDPNNTLPPGQAGPTPKTPLVAVYPKEGTLWSDNPLFVLDAPWVSDEQRQGAHMFEEFVTSADHQRDVLQYGFRPGNPDVGLGSPIDTANGVDPSQPRTILPVPPGDVLTALLGQFDQTRKAARVLLVLDVSGSMGDSAGVGRFTKLELAKQAVAKSLDLFSDRDDVGLWIFSTELDGQTDYQELVPIGPIGPNRDRMRQMVNGLSPLNGTGLYDTTEAGVRTLEKVASQDRITAMLLLTDGRNEDDTNSDLDALLRSIGRQGEKGDVRVFAIAYGKDASVDELKAITQATNGKVYESKDPADIGKVFSNVVSNF